MVTSLDPAEARSRTTRALFAVRHRLGAWLGWDREPHTLAIPEDSETTLSARLPEDLRGTVAGPALTSKGFDGLVDFKPLYRTDFEWAAELSNQTVHAIMHLAWVEKSAGVYQGQMGVYVKPRGWLGSAYMAAITPFRHLIVYPALIREVERAWNDGELSRAGSSDSRAR